MLQKEARKAIDAEDWLKKRLKKDDNVKLTQEQRVTFWIWILDFYPPPEKNERMQRMHEEFVSRAKEGLRAFVKDFGLVSNEQFAELIWETCPPDMDNKDAFFLASVVAKVDAFPWSDTEDVFAGRPGLSIFFGGDSSKPDLISRIRHISSVHACCRIESVTSATRRDTTSRLHLNSRVSIRAFRRRRILDQRFFSCSNKGAPITRGDEWLLCESSH